MKHSIRCTGALILLGTLAACTTTVYVDRNRTPEVLGESPPVDRSIFPTAGSRQFVTANQRELLSQSSSQYTAGNSARGELADADGVAGASPEGEAPPQSTNPEPMPEPDPTRAILEGDIFRVEGNLLYVLHRYRGLLIFDVAEPDRIRLLGRLRFQAMPVEMYVRDGRAYAVVSDYFQYWQFDADADPLGFHGSQVLIADVSQPTAPLLLGRSPVSGEVSDTRMVGDILYVVSKRNPQYWRYNTADWEDTTWVMSLNVADPANIHQVDELKFAGTSTVMSVYHHAIFVAAHDPNAYLTDPAHEGQTLLTYVDISDPLGKIRTRGGLYVPGYIQDKFKIDYDQRTVRVFSQRYLSGQSDGFIHTVDVSYPDQPALVSSLDLSSYNYGSLAATRMAGGRGYALTRRWAGSYYASELHVLDLSDPTSPHQTGTLAVNGTINHFEVRGDRLLAIGRTYDTSVGGTWYSSVSLFDVSDPAAPALLSRVRLGSGYSYSLANSDYKAFRVIDSQGLILVPLRFWDGGTSFNGIQLIDYSGDTLTARGLVGNAGQVERAFPVGDRIVSLSQQQIQVIDARNRDNPVITASLHLIRNVLGVWNIKGKQVQLVGPVLSTGSRLEVIPFGREDDGPVISSLPLPFSGWPVVFRDGDVLRLIGWEASRQVIRNADLTDPAQPRLRGRLELASEFERIYNQGFPFYYLYWSPWAGLPLGNRLLPVTVRKIVEHPSGRRDFQSWLRLIDLRDIDNPRVASGELQMPKFPFVNKVTHGSVLHSSHVEETKSSDGSTLLFHVKSYVDRIDVSDPDHPRMLPKLNVPGYLVDASPDGKVLFTVDYQWDAFGRRRNSVNMLRVDGEEAVLVDVLAVGDQVNRAVFREGRIWLVTHKYPWWGVSTDTLASRQPYTILSRIDVDLGGQIVGQTAAKLAGYHFDLLDVEGSRAYLGSNYPYGVMVLDVRDPARPDIVSSARTINYVSKIVRADDHLYLPLGWFGVHRIPLPH